MDILLTGSVAYDYLMKFPGYFRDHILPDHLNALSLSFLVDSMTRLRGGVAPNIAYTLALLGAKPRLWATVGEDFEEYRKWLESKGIETAGLRVIPGEFTASFFVNTDLANAQIASFYPGAMAYAPSLSLHELASNPPDLVVISPNEPKAMVQYVEECKRLSFPYIYDPGQQVVRMDGDQLKEGIRGAEGLFVNEYEFALIEKATRWGIKKIIEENPQLFVVVTKGEHGAVIYTKEGEVPLPIVAPRCIVDPTGVGDAFRGGFLKGYSHSLSLLLCGYMGALAATYCLESAGSQGHSYSIEEFVQRFRCHFDDQGKLDEILQVQREQR